MGKYAKKKELSGEQVMGEISMDENLIADPVPTNAEMYNRICGGRPLHQGDKMAIECWNKLMSFSKAQNLLESNFEDRIKDNFQGCLWEIYLPMAFYLNGILLSRAGKKGPDFCFERKGKRIWLEAVVCGEPQGINIVPPPILNGGFEHGIAPDAEIMQRLATAVSSKIKKFEEAYSQKIQGLNDYYVIALNGYRGINNYVHDRCFQPYIVKTLYGMGDYNRFYEGRGVKIFLSGRIVEGVF